MIACLCHDLDHRGTNNSFQVKSSSNLAQLYSTSTMEHHHFDQCLMILNSKGNQILSHVSQVRRISYQTVFFLSLFCDIYHFRMNLNGLLAFLRMPSWPQTWLCTSSGDAKPSTWSNLELWNSITIIIGKPELERRSLNRNF